MATPPRRGFRLLGGLHFVPALPYNAGPMADRPDLAAAFASPLVDAAGVPTTLRAQLGPRATVVGFLRHFG